MRYSVYGGIQDSFRTKLLAAILTLAVSIGIPVVTALWFGRPEIAVSPNTTQEETRQPPPQPEKTEDTVKEPRIAGNSQEPSGQPTTEPPSVSPPPPETTTSRPVGGRGGGPPPDGANGPGVTNQDTAQPTVSGPGTGK